MAAFFVVVVVAWQVLQVLTVGTPLLCELTQIPTKQFLGG
jgi:hypothetical protein